MNLLLPGIKNNRLIQVLYFTSLNASFNPLPDDKILDLFKFEEYVFAVISYSIIFQKIVFVLNPFSNDKF